jgi:biopolymer transport protein ExbB
LRSAAAADSQQKGFTMRAKSWLVGLVMAMYLAPAGAARAQEEFEDETAARAAVAAAEPVTVDRVIRELKRQYKAGGTTMHFILALSTLGVAFILERAFRLRRKHIAPAGLAQQADALWKARRFAEFESLAKRHDNSTLGRILLFILHHRNNPIDQINAAASDISSRDMARHLMLTYPLATVAVLAPLLGLFGTVIGMIESFETVAVAGTMGDPSLLSSSISKALVTTAYGLMVAMPILFCYGMLKLRTNYLANELDEEASALINDWFLNKQADAAQPAAGSAAATPATT